MSERFFDDLARTLASPMPRRRALRLAGVAALAAVVPGLRPRAALGTSPCGPDTPCSSLCQLPPHVGACGIPIHNSCGQELCHFGYGGCMVAGDVCCKTGPDPWICPKNYKCAAKHSAQPNCIGCPEGLFPCGKRCCSTRYAERQVCYRGECLKKCPPNTTECGGGKQRYCCPPNQECRNGKCCNKCGGNGTCCDPATTYCCREPGDPKSPGRCCKKDKETCCGVGPDGAQKRMCCPKPNKCVKQLPPGKGGFTKSSPWVCCPPDRQVPLDENHLNDVNACCAPGQVSLGGKLVIGSGIQGLCCDEEKICGSGASLTCCQTFSTEIGTDLNQTCCSGKCVSLQYDASNCGSCGKTCAAGERCQRGMCVAA